MRFVAANGGSCKGGGWLAVACACKAHNGWACAPHSPYPLAHHPNPIRAGSHNTTPPPSPQLPHSALSGFPYVGITLLPYGACVEQAVSTPQHALLEGEYDPHAFIGEGEPAYQMWHETAYKGLLSDLGLSDL